jgi:hypothetical protein
LGSVLPDFDCLEFRYLDFGFGLGREAMKINPNSCRFLLILLAGFSLLTGLWAAIARMGWLLPVPNSQFVLLHGPLMVVAFSAP